VHSRELPNGVNRAHRLIIKSHHFLERALASFTQSDADFNLMDSVASLEFSPESSERGDGKINAAVPMRDFTLGRCAWGAGRCEHRDRLENRGFSGRIWTNSTKPNRVDSQD
jgi:hypothetical protein